MKDEILEDIAFMEFRDVLIKHDISCCNTWPSIKNKKECKVTVQDDQDLAPLVQSFLDGQRCTRSLKQQLVWP